MEIKITLDSPRIQEMYDRGGKLTMLEVLNKELGFGAAPKERSLEIHGVVYDINGNECGTWEIVRA